VALKPKPALSHLALKFYKITQIRHTHKHTQPVGLLWTSNQPAAKSSTFTIHKNIRQEYNALSGIRKHNPSNQAAADLYALDRTANFRY